MAEPCKNRIVMGDQGIYYCPDCMECECCTPEWSKAHGQLDYECLVHDGECVFVDNPNFPRHVCLEPFEISTALPIKST